MVAIVPGIGSRPSDRAVDGMVANQHHDIFVTNHNQDTQNIPVRLALQGAIIAGNRSSRRDLAHKHPVVRCFVDASRSA